MRIKIIVYLMFLMTPVCIYAQGDSIEVKKQKGILFISKLNPNYDWKASGHVITEKMFSDFFFPIVNLADTNIEKIFKYTQNFDYGIKLYKFSNRDKLKSKAKKVICDDTSGCYSLGYFYAITVEVQYRLYPYNQDASVCGKHYLNLKTKNGHLLHFSILNKGISDLVVKEYTLHKGNKVLKK